VLGVHELHAGEERHLPEMRHVRQHDGVFVRIKSGRRGAAKRNPPIAMPLAQCASLLRPTSWEWDRTWEWGRDRQ